MTARGRRRSAWITAAATLSLVGCTDDAPAGERPTPETWEATWVERQALVPARTDLLDDGAADLCSRLVGVFREQMPALTPAPVEAMEPAVEDWVRHVETIVFDCPDDPSVVDASYEELDVLTAEVDAALDASR